ncbi:HAD-IIA family hydrolase [Actinokineospora diospyrosa]|uniref:Haloacid Dehalogenase Superfamily Class (Subfamily) IIA n=1 Tax=Actinokineospora diospyrosa TaxID=103728 RepID=A0ABT1ILV1_9PSEU|nr:HAD-IIA family hydrolase [Actinokineospora diospyrosa]MCP2273645.1 Haloacid Dehalogenase Superfamily Class (subfamily) IIA [Actinokineospora diospyrosa]
MGDRLLDGYDALLFDLDGTVYRGGQAISGAAAAVAAARADGTTVRFVTNNASRSPAQVAEHLTGLGVPTEPGEVSTSAQAAAAVLAARLTPGEHVLVLGTSALAAEVTAVGLTPVRTADGVAAVVQGLSPDLSWNDLAEAAVAINAGALWIACNVDRTLPTERGLLPGNGSLVHALRYATEREPEVAGKPATPLMDESVRAAAAHRPLVVGDRLDTDIEGAVTAGLDSLLVLTGVATPADVLAAGPEARPTYLAADLTAITAPVADLEIGPKPGWSLRLEHDTITITGDGDPLDLLRALCATTWSAPTPPHLGDHPALATLGLTRR